MSRWVGKKKEKTRDVCALRTVVVGVNCSFRDLFFVVSLLHFEGRKLSSLTFETVYLSDITTFFFSGGLGLFFCKLTLAVWSTYMLDLPNRKIRS